MAPTKKRRGKRRKRRARMPMERSKLPANRVVDANQYLHLQRRMDEIQGVKLGKTRADRRSDYARSHGIVNIINVGSGGGTGFQTLGAGEREALDMLRNAPDGLTPAEKRKKQQDREQAYYDRVRESYGPDDLSTKIDDPDLSLSFDPDDLSSPPTPTAPRGEGGNAPPGSIRASAKGRQDVRRKAAERQRREKQTRRAEFFASGEGATPIFAGQRQRPGTQTPPKRVSRSATPLRQPVFNVQQRASGGSRR